MLACARTRQSSRFLRFIWKGTQMRAQRLEKLALTQLCPRDPNRLLRCKLKSKKVVQETWYSVRARINTEGKLTCTIMSFGKRSRHTMYVGCTSSFGIPNKVHAVCSTLSSLVQSQSASPDQVRRLPRCLCTICRCFCCLSDKQMVTTKQWNVPSLLQNSIPLYWLQSRLR